MKRTVLILIFTLLTAPALLRAQEVKPWKLEECIEYALTQNIQVRKSVLSNDRLQYYADQAKAQRFPSVNASVNQNFNWSKSTATGASGLTGSNGSNYSVNSGVTIYNGSRISNSIKQAELDIEGGKLSLETTKESISLNILNAFLQVLYAEEQVKNTAKQIESTNEQLNLAKERLTLKIISQADYAQVKSQLASEKLTMANAESQLSIAKVNLMQLMELPVTADFNIAHPNLGENINQNRTANVKSVYETSLSIKPQIKYAAINKDIAAIDEKIARAGYFPVLSASGGISSAFTSQVTDPYFDQINNGIHPSVGLSLSIPIYQKKQVKTNIAVAKIGYEDAILSETDTKNQLRKNIEQACLDVTSAQIEYEASLEKFQATQEASSLSDEKFKQGIINSVDYLVSKTNLIVSESQLLQSKYNLIFSYKVLDFYTGIPLSL
ncbi:MAG: TolC family protein [Bacteroidales bacterium]|nr:TolC family protein [Bacteroidales bacterium]